MIYYYHLYSTHKSGFTHPHTLTAGGFSTKWPPANQMLIDKLIKAAIRSRLSFSILPIELQTEEVKNRTRDLLLYLVCSLAGRSSLVLYSHSENSFYAFSYTYEITILSAKLSYLCSVVNCFSSWPSSIYFLPLLFSFKIQSVLLSSSGVCHSLFICR